MNKNEGSCALDSSVETIPEAFVWPEKDRAADTHEEIEVPAIDLQTYLNAEREVREEVLRTLHKACCSHGVFLVVNHGVDDEIFESANREMDSFFSLALTQKQKAHRRVGESSGFCSSFIGRFACNLPWKETLSVEHTDSEEVAEYILRTMGTEFMNTGVVWETYCKEMQELGLVLMELLGSSLGVESRQVRRMYENGRSILRLNYYPPCKRPDLVLGTGPHCDPTSLTILHQDQVSGLQLFFDNRWLTLRPVPGALVVNIGDTFMAFSNGVYKSSLHRAVVNSKRPRKSIAYFLNPPADKLIRPPAHLQNLQPRKYPDFTWAQLLHFTQKHYRSDMNTLDAFSKWLSHSNQTE
eukprot:TRINITY_DN3898_c0_g1_i3.p1 TRINITY_DN3898_c0_g1~~TRINITY_DN3898_c0_g1_i3.p1  ORF type:complete len:354 (+),score=48.28 TRINITY_DN3898_c0_g1_i3:87-1148(+)